MNLPLAPIRVAVVDDSAVMRRLIASALTAAPDIRVVGAARDAAEARDLIKRSDPDVVTLDVVMPGMNGLDFLRRIMTLRPTPVVIVANFATQDRETRASALQIGAVEIVRKPQGPEDMQPFAALLQAKVRLAASARPLLARRPPAGDGGHAQPARLGASAARRTAAVRILIAIGASTGGVGALSKLLAELPDCLPPIVIVQHMPPGYPERFAARLRSELRRDVAEARSGEILSPGAIRLAPGDRHLRVRRGTGGGIQTDLDDGAPVTGHRPSVDVLFESVAQEIGARALGVILTGMGRDGAAGLAAMRRSGAACLGQDRASSVVWGMPRAALEMDALDEQATLDALPGRIRRHLGAP